MRLYVVRHSHPQELEPDDEDYEDPGLDDEGEEIAVALATWMVASEEIPTVIYASPTARTQETAKILAEAFGEAGYARPEVETDGSIGPHMSIRGLVERLAGDETQRRVLIVSHHESIEHGMRVMNLEPWIHLDILAQGELRVLKVKRKSLLWEEKARVLPSDNGLYDNY